MAKQRLYYLDALKGILIILVILGHSIQYKIMDYQHDVLFRVIYSFHMPLFFLISGFLTYKGRYDAFMVKKRFVQCIIPFVSWAFLLPIFESGIYDFERTIKILTYPDNGLWFLYNLFFYCLVFNLSERWSNQKNKQEYLLLTICVMLYVLMTFLHTRFNVTQICWYLPFFAMGYYIRKYPNTLDCKGVSIVIMGGYILTVPFWMMRDAPLFYRWVNLGGVFSYGYRYFVEFAGAYTFYILGKQFLNIHIPFINYLGTKTLGIYAFQFIVLYHFALKCDTYFCILITTIICIFLSLILVEVVHRIKYIRLFLIGER